METRANHVLIGAFTLGVSLLLVVFALWLAKYTADKAFAEYDVIFSEAVTGLSKGGIVAYNGIAVGEVRELSLAKDDPRKVVARVRLDADTPVKVDTKAKLAIVGLTGVAQIQFSGGSPGAERLKAVRDQPRPVIYADTSALQKLLESSEDIATTASEVLLRINRVLADANLERIERSLANIEGVTAVLFEERSDLATMIESARGAAERLERTFGKTDAAMTQIDRELLQRLPGMVDKLERSLANIDSLTAQADGILKDNRGAIGEFGNQGLTQVGPAVTELRDLIRDLDRTVKKLDRNPAGFVLGRGKPEEFEP
ncbi:MAG TPA: MlaD family protein [Arenimonas sp.]|nr:MlaD family protein [Arenimonas sp.]